MPSTLPSLFNPNPVNVELPSTPVRTATEFVKPPFNFTGCKFKLLPQIAPLFDYQKEILVDLFTGGGSIWCNLAPYYRQVIANDIIQDLVGIQEALLEGDEIIAATRQLCVAKEDKAGYHRRRDEYNANPTPAGLWALCLTCNNNCMRFNRAKRFNQTFGWRSWNDSTTEKVGRYVHHIRPLKSRVAHRRGDFAWLPIPPNSMVYVDPPYSNTEAGYNSYWAKHDDQRLFEHLLRLDDQGHSLAVSGVLTHNGKESPLLNQLLATGWQRHDVLNDYNVVSKVGKKETKEVLLTNYFAEPRELVRKP